VDDVCEENEKLLDLSLKPLFQEPEYRDQFLLLLIDTFRDTFIDSETGNLTFHLDVPAEVRAYTHKQLAKSTTIAGWFKSRYELTGSDDNRLPKETFWMQYQADHSIDGKMVAGALGRNKLYSQLSLIMRVVKSDGFYYFTGVKEGVES
jgi:hypothetical protein